MSEQIQQIMLQIGAASGRIGGYTLAIQQLLNAMHQDTALIQQQREALAWIAKTDAERDAIIAAQQAANQNHGANAGIGGEQNEHA